MAKIKVSYFEKKKCGTCKKHIRGLCKKYLVLKDSRDTACEKHKYKSKLK